MPIFKAPYSISKRDTHLKSIFLAGSIEQNTAHNWQELCEEILTNSFNVFNPRREHWDPDLEQDVQEKEFNNQVSWEMDAMETADIILMYFQPGTKSPISLLELGLHASSGKMIVVCPEGFWRKENVDFICTRFNIPHYESMDEALSHIQEQMI